MNQTISVCLLLYLSFMLSSGYGLGILEKQTVIVSGQLFCENGDGSPFSPEGETIELYELDRDSRHDLLGSTISSINGSFQLSGSESELFSIEPFLVIKARCENPFLHMSPSPLSKYCHFEVQKELEQNGLETEVKLGIVIDTAIAPIVCSQNGK